MRTNQRATGDGRLRRPRVPGRRWARATWLAAGLWAVAALAGCADQTVHIYDPNELVTRINTETRPVLVCFYKYGCVTSMALDPGLLQLAKEYGDRIVVVRYLHLFPWFQVNSIPLGFEHKVWIVPMVILFVNGREVQRWPGDYYLPHYRDGIDRALAEQAPPPVPSPQPPPLPPQARSSG